MEDELNLLRCNYIARLSQAYVKSNPKVGCVITKNKRILAEGYHKMFGEEHAEIVAIEKLQNDNPKWSDCDFYVNLEPCSHYGKTPPCADKLVALNPKSVTVSHLDPTKKVNGKGLDRISTNGIKTKRLEIDPHSHGHKHFLYSSIEKLPWLTIKFAESSDKFIGSNENGQVKISNHITDIFVHRLRAEHQAIMVGTNTIINDNPSLNNRHYYGYSPTPIVLDRNAKLTGHENIFNQEQSCIYISSKKSTLKLDLKMQERHQIVLLDQADLKMRDLFAYVYKNLGIKSILVEGGKTFVESIVNENIWCDSYIISANISLGKGIKSPEILNSIVIAEQKVLQDRIQYSRNQKLKFF